MPVFYHLSTILTGRTLCRVLSSLAEEAQRRSHAEEYGPPFTEPLLENAVVGTPMQDCDVLARSCWEDRTESQQNLLFLRKALPLMGIHVSGELPDDPPMLVSSARAAGSAGEGAGSNTELRWRRFQD